MKITYDTSVDDRVAFNVYHFTHSRSAIRARIIVGVLLPVGLFLFICALNFSESGWRSVPYSAIFPGLMMLWFYGGHRRRIRKNVLKLLSEGDAGSGVSVEELEVTSEGLVSREELAEGKYNWKAIRNIASTPDYYFIYTGVGKALVIPKLKVTEGDFEEFRRLVEDGFRRTAVEEGGEFDESKIAVDDRAIGMDARGSESRFCGVASLAGGILAVALWGTVIGIGIAVTASAQGEEMPKMPVIATYLVVLAIVANILGMIYSISGLGKANQKKLLPIVGLAVNCGVVLLAVVLVLVLVLLTIVFG